MDDQPGTYEEWRVTGEPGPGYPSYAYTWSRRRQPDLVDPEGAARRFVAKMQPTWDDGPHLHRRTVTIREWRPVETNPRPRLGPRRGRYGRSLHTLRTPRREHGGPSKLGACPDQGGITAKRFSIAVEE
jgi:hypothetical protein